MNQDSHIQKIVAIKKHRLPMRSRCFFRFKVCEIL